MKIARVFPTKTSMTPTDPDAYWGPPDLFTPRYDEIHISVAFTWDIPKAENLKRGWEHIAPVKISGPAIDGESLNGFTPGVYVRKGCTVTSRGCPNRCSFCFIHHDIIELNDFPSGNNILDNNFLACSKPHRDKVYDMLSGQNQIEFSGGLEASRLTDYDIERLRGLKIKHLFFAYDSIGRRKSVSKAGIRLSKYFKKYKLRCYVLVGYRKNDTPEKAEGRLIETWEMGFYPFAMLYRDKGGSLPEPYKEWRSLQHKWTRPAGYKTWLKENRYK